MRFLIFSSIFGIIFADKAIGQGVGCLQCGGIRHEKNVRILRDKCCNATLVTCQPDEMCMRALVYSPYGDFILSGCHPKEDSLSGCDFHNLPHNSTVYRCVCSDSECQNDFPGDCPIKGIEDHHHKKLPRPPTSTSSPIRDHKKVPRGKNRKVNSGNCLRNTIFSMLLFICKYLNY